MSGDGSETKGAKETIAEEARGLASKIYDDVGKPVLAPVGDLLGGLTKLVLGPVKFLVDGANRLSAQVGEKLRGVPSERLQLPPATIAGPAAMHYALLGDGDEVARLREMFEDLLVASMDRGRAADVHPAFVSIISQLTPDEAWILKSIVDPLESMPIVEVRYKTASEQVPLPPGGLRVDVAGPYRIAGFACRLGIGIGVDESRQSQYLSNLSRVGIIEIDWTRQIEGTRYSELADQLKEYVAPEGTVRAPLRGVVELTPLGIQFLRTCVGSGS
jgi:hypothetical protein